MIPKPVRQINKKLREYIRRLPCVECMGGEWDRERGVWRNDASHVYTIGSGHGDEYNLVSHCRTHHIRYERSTKEERARLEPLAIQLTKDFYESNIIR